MQTMIKPDVDTFVKIFEKHYGLVLEAARRYAPAPDLAYDIVQQTFIDFVQGAAKHHWDPECDLRPLLYEIAKNNAHAFWKKEEKQKTLAIRAFEEQLIQVKHPRKPSQDADFQRQTHQRLRECVQKLAPRSQRLIERHYFEGVSMENIAAELQGSANTIRQIFCRIRVKLRKCIEQGMKD